MRRRLFLQAATTVGVLGAVPAAWAKKPTRARRVLISEEVGMRSTLVLAGAPVGSALSRTVTDSAGLIDTATATSATAGATSWGWELTASNTGLAAAGIDRTTLATFSGTPVSGQTISLRKITSAYDLGGFNNGNFNGPLISNVTFDRCWFATGAIRHLIAGPGTTLTNCEIDGTAGPSTTDNIAVYANLSAGQTVLIDRCYIHNVSVGAWLDGDPGSTITVRDSYLTASTSGTAHVDGFTRRAGTGTLTVQRCRLAAVGQSVTGAFFLQPTFGAVDLASSCSDTLFEGATITLVLESKTGATTNAAFSNCRLNPDSGAGAVSRQTFGGTINTNPFTVWLYNTGAAVNSTDGGRKGTVVT